MKRNLFLWLVAGTVAAQTLAALAQPSEFSFGVIAHPFKTIVDEPALRAAINESDADNLAFVVVNGIKASAEPCTDKLYQRRKALFDDAKNGLIVSLAGSDWSECKNTGGKQDAVERLNRLRDLFFSDEFSLGASKIPLVRQSTTAKFRSYAENARWEVGPVLFATINLPANNNHYRTAAGRNNEFEDRLIANHDWLQRLFTFAARKKLDGIVLFCDGNPLFKPGLLRLFDLSGKRDGFVETRQLIGTLAAKFAGKVLLIHGKEKSTPAAQYGITWHNNLGNLALESGWVKLNVNPFAPTLFAVSTTPASVGAPPQ